MDSLRKSIPDSIGNYICSSLRLSYRIKKRGFRSAVATNKERRLSPPKADEGKHGREMVSVPKDCFPLRAFASLADGKGKLRENHQGYPLKEKPEEAISRRPIFPEIVIAIVGPTAVGKSEVSLELAKEINGEIISCDSMQVYREMEVMTSKPKREARDAIPHHLIGSIGVNESYSAADFSKQARGLIMEIHRRVSIPLVVGGSGLYIKALVDGIFPDAKANWKVRRRLYQEAKEKGNEYLYQRLKEIDPHTSSQLYPQDVRRVVRALEVWEIGGIPISKLKKKTEGISRLYPLKIFGLIRERGELYQRINQRVDRMFNDGLVDEVKRLLGVKVSHSARQVLGYEEVKGFLDRHYTLQEAKRLLKRNTRRFAKRQLCWFRRDERIVWIKISESQGSREVADILKSKIQIIKQYSVIGL